jgi:hypothetical protein
VRTWQGARNFVDGNRIDRGTVERLYRDGHGRTRIEREVQVENIVHGEPDASLFLIPSDYSRVEAPVRQADAH